MIVISLIIGLRPEDVGSSGGQTYQAIMHVDA
jgi:hypothetical protein